MTLSKRESPIFQCAMFRFYVKPWQGIIIFLSPGLGWIYSSYTYDCYDHRTSAKNCDQTFSHALRMRWMVGWGARCKSLSGRRVKSCQTRAIKSIKTPSWKSDHGINKWIKFCNRFSVQSFWQVARRSNYDISTWIRPSFWSSSGTNDSKSQEQGPLPVSSCAQTCRGPTWSYPFSRMQIAWKETSKTSISAVLQCIQNWPTLDLKWTVQYYLVMVGCPLLSSPYFHHQMLFQLKHIEIDMAIPIYSIYCSHLLNCLSRVGLSSIFQV